MDNWFGFWKHYYALKKDPTIGDFSAIFRNGMTAIVPKALMSAFDEVFLREVYNNNITSFSENLLIIDIGANVGYFTLYILDKQPNAHIVAYEPLPSNILLLEQHKAINKINNLIIDKRAVHGTAKDITINYNDSIDYSVGASILNRDKATGSITIPAVSIPDIFIENKITTCDLLKVDCEGAEYNIIFNCPDEYFEKINNIVIEVHDWVPKEEGTPAQLIKFLEEKNYTVNFIKNEILWCHRINN
jgi:FkbM family methyltransferase